MEHHIAPLRKDSNLCRVCLWLHASFGEVRSQTMRFGSEMLGVRLHGLQSMNIPGVITIKVIILGTTLYIYIYIYTDFRGPNDFGDPISCIIGRSHGSLNGPLLFVECGAYCTLWVTYLPSQGYLFLSPKPST